MDCEKFGLCYFLSFLCFMKIYKYICSNIIIIMLSTIYNVRMIGVVPILYASPLRFKLWFENRGNSNQSNSIKGQLVPVQWSSTNQNWRCVSQLSLQNHIILISYKWCVNWCDQGGKVKRNSRVIYMSCMQITLCKLLFYARKTHQSQCIWRFLRQLHGKFNVARKPCKLRCWYGVSVNKKSP